MTDDNKAAALQQLRVQLCRVLDMAERCQNVATTMNDDAGIFWEGYQAAVHDLLCALDTTAQELSEAAVAAMGRHGPLVIKRTCEGSADPHYMDAAEVARRERG